MGQISIVPISQVKSTTDAEPQAQPLPAEARETIRQVAAAVDDLNAVGYAGQDREITFSVDRETKLPVVKVIDAKSKEVIQQWPRDSVLHLAAQLHQEGLTG